MEYGDIANYVNGVQHLSQGWQDMLLIPDPAAGAVFSRKIPPETWEKVIAVRFNFQASGVVANRFLAIQYLNADDVVFLQQQSSGTVVAGNLVTPNLFVGGSGNAGGASGATYGVLPDLLLPSGYSWRLNVSGLDAGDQASLVRVLVQRIPSDVASGDRYYEVLEAWRAMTGG